MDGNGRWAKQRGLPRTLGHKEGTKSVRTCIDAARKYGVPYITFYAFSVENWGRPKLEIEFLFATLKSFLKRWEHSLHEHKTRLHVIGGYTAFPDKLVKELDRIQAETKHYTDYNICLALNYGARTELLKAIERYREATPTGTDESLSWEDFSCYLDTAEIPDPDMIIRTSGEQRLSNFLLLQSAYAELYFTETLWPDFDEAAFVEALEAYAKRERRFGKTSEQIQTPQ